MSHCHCQHGATVILPLVSKAWGNTKTVTIHLREVHYRMAIMCNICRLFASMNVQIILDHHPGCKAKCDKENAEPEGHEKVKNHTRWSPSPGDKTRHPNYPDWMSPRSHEKQNATLHLLSSPTRTCKSVHFLNLSGLSQLHFSGKSLLSQMNCHFFLQSECL